ncbi:hypothetical protein [Oceanobacillus halotolerans]|uniref:hypothetical protein n=1 Tax=Oceanobacillus halotolerans TaxID=2663380 RepID=UPI0013DBB17A|nr:hypothetical protein [Oceanobacillus halotolerans]
MYKNIKTKSTKKSRIILLDLLFILITLLIALIPSPYGISLFVAAIVGAISAIYLPIFSFGKWWKVDS